MKHQHGFYFIDSDGEEWTFGMSEHSHVNGDEVHRHDGVHGSRHKLAMRSTSETSKDSKDKKNSPH